MRLRILLALSVVLLLSVGVATGAAKRPSTASQQLCESYGGTYSTKASSSFFAPLDTKHVLWTCNSYSSGSDSTQALDQSCTSDGGHPESVTAGFATCWKGPAAF